MENEVIHDERYFFEDGILLREYDRLGYLSKVGTKAIYNDESVQESILTIKYK